MKRTRKKFYLLRTVSFLLISFVILSVTSSLTVGAEYTFGSAYKSGKYYTQLKAYTLTGDMRRDVVSVALTQVGYHEGNSESEMHGTNTSGSKNFVEYNRIYGKLDNGEGNGTSYGYSWCCAFVSWCMRQANVPTSVVTTEVSCPRMITWLKSNSKYVTRSSGYTPIAGDMIFFKSSTSSQTASHIGIVLGVSGSTVYTVEGNSNNNVSIRSYSLTDTYIVGYGIPKYTVKNNAEYDFVPEITEKSLGKYKITADSLNIRKGAGTSYDIIGTLKEGASVEILEISGSWGRIFYNGDTGWISVNYAEKIGESSLGKIYVTASSLTVRNGPGTSYDAIGYLSNGDEVELLATDGSWGRIKFNGQDGWISTKYVSDQSPETTANAQTVPQTTPQTIPQTTPQTSPEATSAVPQTSAAIPDVSQTTVPETAPSDVSAQVTEAESTIEISEDSTTGTPPETPAVSEHTAENTDAAIQTSAPGTENVSSDAPVPTVASDETETPPAADTGCTGILRTSVILTVLITALVLSVTVMLRKEKK
ncbi:MAG: SH3 domain-containing protein [Clostridia bacterium]|nr:SH3 domain-containing protein [Clostridia bacterium]